MDMNKKLLIFGSYGFTGNLIVERATNAGFHVILSGRDEIKLKAQAEEWNVPYKKASLDLPGELDEALTGVDVVLHCAGPFVHTWKPIADACLRNSCHYLDITGEIPVFESLRKLDKEFREKKLMAMPGAGFDVVPTDCVANYLNKSMPDATHLELAFKGLGGSISRGTAKTMVENLGSGGAIREAGKLKTVPPAYKTRKIIYQEKEESSVSIPWGDVSTAYASTGIENIIVYTAMPVSIIKKMKWMKYLSFLLKTSLVKRYLKRRIDKNPPGPNADQREKGRSFIWGEVRNAKGETKQAILETVEGYRLTAEMGVVIAERVIKGDYQSGYQTPAMAYGHDLIFSIEGSKWIKS
ncbi:MAG: saccharopine dehydrogenase NADP-binding domain-containing protein [Balneolaceae bacterium]|nr:saccharopine dehydrogenase NADP-binding domain-containing protein [Balneolaceae bacterium]